MRVKMFKSGKRWTIVFLTAVGVLSFGNRVDQVNADIATSNSSVFSQSHVDSSVGVSQSVDNQQSAANSVATNSQEGTKNTETNNQSAQITVDPAENSTNSSTSNANQNNQRDVALATFAQQHINGYVYSPAVSQANGGWNWFVDGQLYTGFRYYAGTYYWFVDGVRQNEGWRQAWGLAYYTDENGRAVQGNQIIAGQLYNFGDDNTYYARPLNGYLYDGSAQNGGYRWYDNGNLYTGFKFYAGTYYWFVEGVRQNEGWRQAWGLTYYTDENGRAIQGVRVVDGSTYFFGNDGTYYLRKNQYYTDGNNIYYANNDGQRLTGSQTIMGRAVFFDESGRLDVSRLNIDFAHQSLNQGLLGAPEGCEGVSFQMALSAKGKSLPDIHTIYQQIGYGFNLPADQGFHGNPFGYGQWYTQTVLANALAKKLDGAFGVQTRDITGAGINDVLIELLSWNPVITYIPWNLQLNNDSNNFHVELIYGYQNGSFKIADPLQIARGANYSLPVGDWQYLNSHVQPTGYAAPASMNVAVI